MCDDFVWNTDVDYMLMPQQFDFPRGGSRRFCCLSASLQSVWDVGRKRVRAASFCPKLQVLEPGRRAESPTLDPKP